MNFGKPLLGAVLLGCALTLVSPAPATYADGSGGGVPMTSSNGMPSGHSQRRRSQVDPQVAYQAGVAALNAGNYAEAITQFTAAQTVLPDNGGVNFALGRAYEANNQKPEARTAYAKAVTDPAAPVGARLQYARLSLELNDRPTAEAQQTAMQAELAACVAPTCTDQRRSQLTAAIAALTQALAAGSTPQGMASADPATSGWSFPTAQEGRLAYAEAVSYINRERYSDALDALARAQAAVGPNADVLNYMGFSSRHLGRLDAALGYYQQALTLQPNHLGANEYLGELYLQMGDVQNARRQLARLDQLCAYGCVQREELSHWIQTASN